MNEESLPDWERLLAAERHLQALVPGSVLVGGTAAALHAGHRISLDGDHVLTDLANRFEVLAEVIERLGAARPIDEGAIDLATYRGLTPPWNDWNYVVDRGRFWAQALARRLLGSKEDGG